MERKIEELKYQVPFKDTTEAGDIVVVLKEEADNKISFTYARIMGFTIDQTKKEEWWHVHFVFLSVPPVRHSIILQTPHFTGQEVFTMGGRKVFIKAINFAAYDFGQADGEPTKKEKKKEAKKGPAKPLFTLVN